MPLLFNATKVRKTPIFGQFWGRKSFFCDFNRGNSVWSTSECLQSIIRPKIRLEKCIRSLSGIEQKMPVRASTKILYCLLFEKWHVCHLLAKKWHVCHFCRLIIRWHQSLFNCSSLLFFALVFCRYFLCGKWTKIQLFALKSKILGLAYPKIYFQN